MGLSIFAIDIGKRASHIVQEILIMAKDVKHKMLEVNINDIIHNYLNGPEHLNLVNDNPHIVFKSNLAVGLKKIKGSVQHIHNAIMNLMINKGSKFKQYFPIKEEGVCHG